MNKIYCSLLFCGLSAFAQETLQESKPDVLSRKHEIKLGAIKLLSGGIAEVTYERIHSDDFTYGVSLLGNLDSKGNSYLEDFSVTPFARMYFTEPKHYGARGFFVEGFGKFISGKDTQEVEDIVYTADAYQYYNYYEKRRSYTAASVGIAIGWKWINRSGFVFEITGGAGRNLGGNSNMPNASFRGDFNLGYRF
ncbi:MAG: hypothetical protein ACLGH8_06585 [Bacteroidia bacterium]